MLLAHVARSPAVYFGVSILDASRAQCKSRPAHAGPLFHALLGVAGYRAPAIWPNVLTIALPSPVRATIATTATSARMSPYSARPWPSSLRSAIRLRSASRYTYNDSIALPPLRPSSALRAACSDGSQTGDAAA